MASLGPCFLKSQVCKPCPPHGRLSLVAVATCHARLPTMDWSSRISNVLSGSVLASMKAETKENDMVARLKIVFWSCRLSHEIWFSNLFMVRHAMEWQTENQRHNNLSQRVSRCHLIIGKLKSRGDGEEQQLFCCIIKPWFLGPTLAKDLFACL